MENTTRGGFAARPDGSIKGGGWSITDMLSTERLDLVEEYIHSSRGIQDLWIPMSELSDSAFKDAATLLILRNDDSDRSEINFSFGSARIRPLLGAGSIYRSIILKYFPGLPLRDGLISTPSAKRFLADSLEEVIAHPERAEEIRRRLAEASAAVGGLNLLEPLRSGAELRGFLREIDEAVAENDRREGKHGFDPYLKEQFMKTARHLNEELKASEQVEKGERMRREKAITGRMEMIAKSQREATTAQRSAGGRASCDEGFWELFFGFAGLCGVIFMLLRHAAGKPYDQHHI